MKSTTSQKRIVGKTARKEGQEAERLDDSVVKQIDGRADRLRKNLVRDVNALQESIADQVHTDIIDQEHYIGTGDVFKKANVAMKEKIKQN